MPDNESSEGLAADEPNCGTIAQTNRPGDHRFNAWKGTACLSPPAAISINGDDERAIVTILPKELAALSRMGAEGADLIKVGVGSQFRKGVLTVRLTFEVPVFTDRSGSTPILVLESGLILLLPPNAKLSSFQQCGPCCSSLN